MKLEIGVSIYSIPHLDMTTLINFILNNDFKAIELWDSSLTERPNRGYEDLNECGIEISIHGPLLDIGDTNFIKNNIRSLLESIEMANRWGANKFILHTGVYNGDRERAFNAARKVIESCVPLLEKTGIIICIENVGYHKNDLIRDFDQMKVFVDIFPKQCVGVVLDVAHANIAGGVKEGISSLGHRIKHIHLSDNNGYGDKENHHRPIGKGNIDFSVLSNLPNQYTAILEIEPRGDWETKLLESRIKLQNLGI